MALLAIANAPVAACDHFHEDINRATILTHLCDISYYRLYNILLTRLTMVIMLAYPTS
jgi:hypothetical protein